jgi:hypothetical protein
VTYIESEFCRVFPCDYVGKKLCDDCRKDCDIRKSRKSNYLIFLVGYELGKKQTKVHTVITKLSPAMPAVTDCHKSPVSPPNKVILMHV